MDSIVLASRPVPVDIEEPIAAAAWTAYVRDVWAARLDARMEEQYWARMRRALGYIGFGAQLLISLASSAAVVTLLADTDRMIVLIVSAVAATCSIGLQITRVTDKVRRAESLVEAWAGRAYFWDEAWRLVLDNRYIGPLADLHRDEAKLARQAVETGLPSVKGWRRAIMDAVEKSDTHAAAGVSGT